MSNPMGSEIIRRANKVYKDIKKAQKERQEVDERHGIETSQDVLDTIAENVTQGHIKQFVGVMEIAAQLTNAYKEFMGLETHQWYFITVRPRPDVEWNEFYTLTQKYLKRACMIEYTYSYEQKSIEGTGEGFHIHIVANTKHKSKGQCLRDTKSTFNRVCADNCVQVKTTYNPNDIINNYLINYIAKDEHKELTKDGDRIWRERIGLLPIYRSSAVIKSITADESVNDD